MQSQLIPRLSQGAAACKIPGGWHLEIPAHTGRGYHLAQLDDHAGMDRRQFAWTPPVFLNLKARVSDNDLPGTWGFGFWNDPFGLVLGFGGKASRQPAIPNTAWFFHASPPNSLSFRDDLPADGFLAGTFRSAHAPLGQRLLPFLGVPFMMFYPAAKWIRRQISWIILQDACSFKINERKWHKYRIELLDEIARFQLDNVTILETNITPRGPLGLILWIDNQYAAFTQQGRLSWGTLQYRKTSWLELVDIDVTNK